MRSLLCLLSLTSAVACATSPDLNSSATRSPQPGHRPESPAQKAEASAQPKSDESRVARIREIVGQIEANPNLKKEGFKVECEKDIKGADVQLSRDEMETRKAQVKTYLPGEGGWEVYTFYYDRGDLIFTLEESIRYKSLSQTPLMQQTDTRYYWDSNDAFRCLEKSAISELKVLPIRRPRSTTSKPSRLLWSSSEASSMMPTR